MTVRKLLCTGLVECLGWLISQAWWLTSNGREDSISKETVPLLPFVDLLASLWYNSSPVPDGTGVKGQKLATRSLSTFAKTDFHAVLPYLMPLLMVSVGEQLIGSTQSVQWYCLLSRNQPESDKPRTCIPVCPRPCSSSATRSTLRRTPVPPALHGKHTQRAMILAKMTQNPGFFSPDLQCIPAPC